MYTVYALYSASLNRLYIGQTKDLAKRLEEHLQGVSFYTRRARDWRLLYSVKVRTRKEAMRSEKELKSHQGRAFLRGLLTGGG